MQRRISLLPALVGAGVITLGAFARGYALPPASSSPARHPAQKNDPRTVALLAKVEAATQAVRTMSADFTYSVTSVKNQQFVRGSLQLMKPNFARVRFSYLAKPAFPSLLASDGKTIFSYVPSSFRADRTFSEGPFDSIEGAEFASGSKAGGGRIGTDPAEPTGVNIHLWDAVPVQSFFGARRAIQNYVYTADANSLKFAGSQNVNGATYRVLAQHLVGGNIAGGEASDFDQHLYIGADNLIHGYVLEFTSAGRHGVQSVWLNNIQVNQPMAAADFNFTPPSATL